MFEKLKRRSLRKLTEKHMLERELSGLNAKVKTLGFLVDEQSIQDFTPLIQFSESLGLAAKDVRVFFFLESKRKIPSLRQDQVYNRDFDWKGMIQNENAREFLDREFDVLVGYYQGTHDFLDAMIAQSRAKFKAGFVGGEERLFDLLIDVDFNKMKLFEAELAKYLQILGKI